LAGIISYLLGSISFAYIISKKIYGIDITEYGSGNPGATNVLRVLGGKAAAAVYAADFLKGFIAVFLAKYIGGENIALICALIVIMGHNWSIFLNFRGGKGIATSMGVGFALAPKIALLCALVGILVIAVSRYVSLGSILGIVLFPIMLAVFHYPVKLVLCGICMAVLAVYRHKENIRRLIRGNERKLGEKVKVR